MFDRMENAWGVGWYCSSISKDEAIKRLSCWKASLCTAAPSPPGEVNHLPRKFLQVSQIFRNEGHTMRQHRPYWHMKVARYSFSGSIPGKFERKLRRHKQIFGKHATTVVLDKDENFSWSGLQWDRSCHSNEMTPLPIVLAAIFLTGNCSYKIVHVICKSVIEIFWDEVFIVRNTVKKRKILMFGRYLKKTKHFWHVISHHTSFNLFKNVCERSWR